MKYNMTDRSHMGDTKTAPFEDAQTAWFWFIMAQQARNEGARIAAGQGAFNRPCEPIDILKIVDRLYRNRRLIRDHLLVLRHYGRRQLAPDPYRVKEQRAHTIWCEAMENSKRFSNQKVSLKNRDGQIRAP